MSHLYHPTYTKKIPKGAAPCTKGGKPAVRWRGRDGEPVVALLCQKKRGRCIVESRVWWIAYHDAAGEFQIAPGSRDKQAASEKMAQLVKRVEQIRAGILPATVEEASELLTEHARDYREHLKGMRRAERHCQQTYQQIEAVLAGCRFAVLADIQPGRVRRWLAEQREAGMSVATSNAYLGAMKAFTRWLCFQVRSYDPLAELRPLNAETDRRRVRRAVSRAEFERLLDAARNSGRTRRGLSGVDRWALYLVASMTGLRASELASLTVDSIDLGSGTVEVEAAYAKGRRRDLLPLAAELMRQIREWLAGRSGKLWPGAWPNKAADMLRADLAVAGIDYRDARGRVFDFHSLRGQFITDLARAGVSITLTQRLARHSSPQMTSRHYTHLELHDLAGAVDRLGVQPKGKSEAV